MIRLWVRLTFFVKSLDQADLWADVPPMIRLWVRLTFFVKSLGQADLWADVPPNDQALGQVDIFCQIFRTG